MFAPQTPKKQPIQRRSIKELDKERKLKRQILCLNQRIGSLQNKLIILTQTSIQERLFYMTELDRLNTIIENLRSN